MAVRTPLYYNGSDLQEMTSGMIDAIKNRVRYLYGASPTVTLTYDGTNTGNLAAMSDTRYKTGTSATSTTSFPAETTTGEPQQVTVTYDYVDQNYNVTVSEPTDTNNKAFPVFYSSGSIQSMTSTDMYDTFILPAIDTLTDGTDQPGTFRVHTANTLSGHTLVNANPIFVDTTSNQTAYTDGTAQGTIGTSGTTQDYNTTITSYYLFQTNNISAPTISNVPLFVDSSNNVQQFSVGNLDTILSGFVRHAAAQKVGTKITYAITTGTSGNQRGSSMVNTGISSTAGTKYDRFVNADDYRSQEFPIGTPTTLNTYYLRISQS